MKAMRAAWTACALVPLLTGCVYYNAMWSAEQYAKGARKLEAQGQESAARSQWAQAAAKAEAVVYKHPKSRWVDDALTLEAEGLARSGSCADAADVIAQARQLAKSTDLRERVDLAAAECDLAAARPIQAEQSLAAVLKSKDDGRRSRAEYFAGQAAMMRLDYEAAAEHLHRSREVVARPLHAHALLASGRTDEARAVMDEIGGDPVFETERADLLAQLAAVGGPAMASSTLDHLLKQTRIPFAEQARLLIADGDRRLTQGDYRAAEDRYRHAGDVSLTASAEASTAHLRLQRLLIMQATQRSDLNPVIEELSTVSRLEGANGDATQLLDLITQAISPPPSAGARFRGAEIARDSLGAPILAGQLFLEVASADTASLYAPKALVAALALLPDRHDSIAGVLDTRYASSPYTLAYRGEASVAYAAAEDSLARELGVTLARPAGVTSSGARFAIPVPGMRGPQLDEGAGRGAQPIGGSPSQARPTRPSAPRPTPAKPARDRPAAADRP